MARVKDLWFSEVKDPSDPAGKRIKRKTARHPDNGGSREARRWLAIWIDPDGTEKSKAFKNREPAKDYGRDMETDVDRGDYIDPDAGKVLFGPLAWKWIRLRTITLSSSTRYGSVNRLHVEPTFAHRQVKAPRPSEILEWLLGLGKTHGTSTQEIAFHIVQGTFDLAVADGLRKDNPARSPIVPRIEREPAEREAWSVAKVWSVTAQHPAPYRAVPILAAGCGFRQGEAFAVAEDDFDFESGTVTIGRQIARIGNQVVFKLPKGGKSRTVPLSPGVARTVKAHIADHPPVPTTLPWMNEDGTTAKDKGGNIVAPTVKLLFVWRGQLLIPPLAEGTRTNAARGRQRSVDGLNLRMSVYNVLVWKAALSRAGVIPPPTNNDSGALLFAEAREDGMHALRHYFATTLLDAGVSLAGVMSFMGHSKKGAPVTLGVYGHVTEETFEAARTAIDRSLFRLRPVQDQFADGTGTERAASQ